MSLKVMEWARTQTVASKPGHRHVLLLMADRAGDDGDGSFPSVGTLAEETGYSERTIQRILRELVVVGAIESGDQNRARAQIKRADRRPNVYRLCVEKVPKTAPNGVTSATNNGVTSEQRGDICDMNGVTSATERGDIAVSPEPSMNHPMEPRTPLTPLAPPNVDPQTWADFLRLRKAKRAPVTATAIEGIEREACKAGITLQDALQTCCANGWQGFRADWYAKKSSTPSRQDRIAEAVAELTGRARKRTEVIDVEAIERFP